MIRKLVPLTNLHVARISRMQDFAHVIECEGKMMCAVRASAYACVCVSRACARVGGSDYGPRGLRCTSCATYNYDYLIAPALCNAVYNVWPDRRLTNSTRPILLFPPFLPRTRFMPFQRESLELQIRRNVKRS